MQVIYQNEIERYGSKGADAVSAIIYIRKIGRYLDRECNGRFEKWKFELCNSKRIFGRFERRI